jgi:small subunit ribosomal protein S15
MSLAKEKKQDVIKSYQTDAKDTGSPEVQVALLTTRISQLSEHMQQHKQDISSRRGLLMMVAKRRKLLDYLKRVDEKRYATLIERLGIRK